MRSGTDNFVIQAVFVIIIVSFVFWGMGNTGPTSSVVAEVNGKRITDTQFNKLARRVARSQGAMTAEQEQAMRSQVLNMLIEKEVMLQEAHHLGLEISDEEVNRDIFSNPNFKGEDGKFSMEIYERTLERSGISRVNYEAEVYENLLLNKLQEVAVMAVQVNDAEVRDRYVASNTGLSVQYVAIPDAAFYSAVEVTQEEIDALVAADAARIQAAYDAQFERRFNEPRKATISTILLRTDIEGVDKDAVKARLEAITGGLAPGEAFEEAARTWSEDLSAVSGGNLGTQSEDQLDPTLAQAVFAAEAGQLTGIIETGRGFQVLWVRELQDAKVTSVEEASPLLARELIQAERAPALADTFAEEVLAEWKALGAPPLEKLLPQGLAPRSEPQVRLDGPGLGPLGPAPALMAALQDAPTGTVLPDVYTVSGQRVIAQVTSRTDADMAAFETEAPKLRQQMRMMSQRMFVQEWRDALIAAAEVERYI
ncbi:MAG: SurA N-terminal domain-containing protein [Alphaproteobacteria bacterium]|nr:SurA N-terminal domain-containing protein [Alphaproteobacteria bacterium]